MSRATVDLQTVRFFLGYGLIFFFQHLFTVVIVSLVAAVADELAAGADRACDPPVLACDAYRYSRVSHPVLKDVQQRVAEVTERAEENAVGIRVIKAFAQEEDRDRAASAPARARLRPGRWGRPAAGPLPAADELAAQPGIAGVLLVGGYQVIDGQLTLGEFFAFNLYLLLLVAAAARVGMRVGQYQRAMASGERDLRGARRATATSSSGRAPAAAGGPGCAALRGGRVRLRRRPAGAAPTSTSTSPPASTVALIGPTGWGKTTLTTLIPRFYDVDGGARAAGRRGRARPHLESLRRAVGMVGQDPSCSRPRCAENIAYGRARRRPGGDRAAAAPRPRPTGSSRDLPDGYETRVGERGLTLSGGQRQRIAIARALLTDPRVLILDEATASVDACTEREIQAALREVMDGRTTLVIAHRLSTISLADEVVVLEAGRIVARGARTPS